MSDNKTKTTEHFDTIIIGAGLSGIGLAYYMQRDCPNKNYLIVEAREASGGTWDLFKYPGIRSDSDLFTFGYEFKPWRDKKAIADGPAILDYIRETARENDIDKNIRYQRKVTHANWNSSKSVWEIILTNTHDQSTQSLTCNWLFSAAGYYNYDNGFTPSFPNIDSFNGQVVHPQHWPEDLDYSDKKVVIIGSGATAVTLLPAMADKTSHITMLQRTPSYILSVPDQDPIAKLLKLFLPEEKAYKLAREKNIALSRFIWKLCQKYPNFARKIIRSNNKKLLPKDFPIDEHFNPPYNPWDQRLCAVPNGDLFESIKSGKGSIVTDHIETFTETGISLKSGKQIDADIVITATGLNVQLFGGITLSIDDQPVDTSKTVSFKGLMLSGIPNFAFAIGYTNSSWTLKVGLICEYFCKLQNYMDAAGFSSCEAKLPSPDMSTRPLLDFDAGYIKRVINELPRQGSDGPWYMAMDYKVDLKNLRHGPLIDENFVFRTIENNEKKAQIKDDKDKSNPKKSKSNSGALNNNGSSNNGSSNNGSSKNKSINSEQTA